MTLRGIAVAACAVLLSACGGPDMDAWQQERDPDGWISDFPSHAATWTDACEDESVLPYTVTLALDSGATPGEVATDLKYGCPDHQGVLGEVMQSTENADAACTTPPDQRDASQARIAEALGC